MLLFLAPESVTLHSMTWSVLLRPWGFSFLASSPTNNLPGGPVDTPSSLTGASQQSRGKQSPLTPWSPWRIFLFLPPVFLWNKWFSVADDWGTHARCMPSCVIHRQWPPPCCCQCILFCLGNVSLQTFLHCRSFFSIVYSFFFLQMNVYPAPYWKTKNYLFALFCNFLFLLMGCLVKIIFNVQ